jgi:hypothetical protein
MAAARMGGVTRIPEGFRPGQIGMVVLGRVIMGDVAVTLVDLARRGRVDVTESCDSDTATTDWMVAVRSRPDPLTGYEQILLDGLADYDEPARLSMLAAEFSLVLSKVRTELIGEAVHRGWLRHWHHGQRTPRGEELARQLRAFRGELHQLKAEQGEDVLVRDWLPYALHFGLISRDRIQLVRFAQSWVDAFKGLESWSHVEPRPRRPDEEISFPKDEWRGMSLDLAAAWEMGL